ncbi:MAG: MFS transporter [Acidobacteriia bacterium]|nr:MFS transporter [Terriglobia bacterium]
MAATPGKRRTSVLDKLGMHPPLAWGFVAVLFLMSACGVESGFLSAYLVGKGFSASAVALVFTVYGITAAFASWLSGALSDVWGPKRVMSIGLVIWLVFHVAFLSLGVARSNYPLVLFFYAMRGFGYPLFAYGFLVWITLATPTSKLGKSLGWFWFAFAGGFPTLGSVVAAFLVSRTGQYQTLWWALVFAAVGGLALAAVRDPSGIRRLAPASENPIRTLLSSATIAWEIPKIGIGGIIRTINTAAQLGFLVGFLVILPVYCTTTVGFTLQQWLRLLTLLSITNVIWNLLFGFIGDKFGWRRTVALFGSAGCAVTTLMLYYSLAGHHYLLAVLSGMCFGATLSAYTPLGAIMAALAPARKGAAMSILNLGAGASAWVGPAVVGSVQPLAGVGGVMWSFAILYVISAALSLLMKVPEDPAGYRNSLGAKS